VVPKKEKKNLELILIGSPKKNLKSAAIILYERKLLV